ncbi:MAG: hypothetical protein ACPGUE_10530 [Marinomonas sp.]
MSNASSINNMPINSSSIDLSVKERSSYYQLLFPYLELENGPKITQLELDNSFFTCPDSLNENATFQQWVKAKTAEDRAQAQASAVSYINSADFIRYPQQLSLPLIKLLDEDFSRLQSREDLMSVIDRHFSSSDNLVEFLASPDFQESLTRIWLSCFSLIIILDYEINWLDQLIRILKRLNFTDKALGLIKNNQTWSEFNTELWLNADLLLPLSVFPLPCSGMTDEEKSTVEVKADTSISSSLSASGVRPYAIGTLHRIEYKLIGYELGELQKVESVLSGESRESQLDFTFKSDSQLSMSQEKQALDKTLASHKEQDLLAHVQHTLADKQVTNTLDKYATQYIATSANASTSGSWTIDEKPRGGDNQASADFIKDVLAKTEQRVSRHVSQVKQVQLSYEQVNKESQRFHNDKDRPLNGFYYWLNKRYRVQALESQKRLMIEINLDLGGDELQRELKKLVQLDQAKPMSLSEHGVNQYSDILIELPDTSNVQTHPQESANNTSHNVNNNLDTSLDDKGENYADLSSAYYLNLYQAYSLDCIEPAPRLNPSLNKSIRSQLASSSQIFTIPKGYSAKKLTVSALVADSVTGLTILLLGQVYPMHLSNGQANQTIVLEGEIEEAIEVSFLANLETGVCPNTGAKQNCSGKQAVSISAHTQVISMNLELALTQERLNQWQLKVYEACQQAYRLQCAEYKVSLETLKGKLKEEDNKVTLSLINRELIKMSIKTLFDHSMVFVQGVAGEPKDLFAYQQYFDYILEWDQLYCKLINYQACNTPDSETNETSDVNTSKRDISTADSSVSASQTSSTTSVASSLKEKAQSDISHEKALETQSLPVLAELDSELYLYRFIKAQETKLLIPVKPGFEKRFMYFYETGRIWHGQESLVPINHGALALINDYKGIRNELDSEKRVKDWQVCLPTVMSVIDEDTSLDNIASHLDNNR